ncbi:hypothetical protein TruAng_010463 [Truncatella angustata]|nr:hypothetical protein TruAng_010463 [Truncatella angustata]
MPPEGRRALSVTIGQASSIGSADLISSRPSRIPSRPRQKYRTLRRTKSVPLSTDEGDQNDLKQLSFEDNPTEPRSPVRVNGKRRKSVTDTTHDGVLGPRRIEQDQEDGKVVPVAQSRGRTRHRTPTAFPAVPEIQLEHSPSPTIPLRSKINTARRASVTAGSRSRTSRHVKPQAANQLTLPATSSNNKTTEAALRLTKGVFLVKKGSGINEYRFPATNSQPEQAWCPGDGFSGDEGNPDFVFYVTGHKKRRRSISMPGIGQLTTRRSAEQTSSIRDSGKHRNRQLSRYRRTTLLRGAAKDQWPTYDNFMDSTLHIRSKLPAIRGNLVNIQPSSEDRLSQNMGIHEPHPTLKYAPKRGDGILDLRNFISSAGPEVHSSYSSAIMRMRTTRMSSPLREPDGETSVDPDEASSEDSIMHEIGYTLTPSNKNSSSSDHSDESLHSLWDEEGNHLYVDDIRALKRQKRYCSEEEELKDGGDGVNRYRQEDQACEQSNSSQESDGD